MEYQLIKEELLKRGFSINDYGSLEKSFENIDITFTKHPFYHVVNYWIKSKDGRTLHVPSDIKLPKKCVLDDILFVVESLVQGVSHNEIVMEIIKRINPKN